MQWKNESLFFFYFRSLIIQGTLAFLILNVSKIFFYILPSGRIQGKNFLKNEGLIKKVIKLEKEISSFLFIVTKTFNFLLVKLQSFLITKMLYFLLNREEKTVTKNSDFFCVKMAFFNPTVLKHITPRQFTNFQWFCKQKYQHTLKLQTFFLQFYHF